MARFRVERSRSIPGTYNLRRDGREVGWFNVTAEEAAEIARHLTQWSEDPGSPREA